MLFGENLCGSHDARLVAVIYGDECYHEGHESLSAAHVSLEQAVHLPARLHVAVYLADDAFLSFCEAEWQMVEIETVEVAAYGLEDEALIAQLAILDISQYVELDVEEFFKLQSQLSSSECFG